MTLKLSPAFIRGDVTPPVSKSIAHRLLICDYLAGANLRRFDDSDDLTATFDALQNLRDGGVTDCRESGSTLRFLIPVCAALGYTQTFVTRGRLSTRPMSVILDALREHGCDIRKENHAYSLSGRLRGGDFTLDCSESSQFAAGLLFALPLCAEASRLAVLNAVSRPYIAMTVKILRCRGICVEDSRNPDEFYIRGGQKYIPSSLIAECDWSAAAFFICAAIMNGELTIRGLTLPSLQGDAAIFSLIRSLGGDIRYENSTLSVRRSALPSFDFDLTDTPDLAPCLAALACSCEGVTSLRGAARLRFKECDRASAIVSNINALGGCASFDGDVIRVEGHKLGGGECDSFGDHRIAMMCAILTMICENDVYLYGCEAVGKSYPRFFDDYFKCINLNAQTKGTIYEI